MSLSLAKLLIRGPRDDGDCPERIPQDPDVKIALRGVNVYYGDHRVLQDVYLDLYRDSVNVLLGASGCGKSTLLRCLNRFVETVPNARMDGVVAIDGRNVMARSLRVTKVRRRFGLVSQRPNPFPRSIFENVAYGPRIHRMADGKAAVERLVRQSLQRAGLWLEVQGELGTRATELSVGQQQRLCIARALAYNPEILLLDEPCSGLDPIAAARIEDLIHDLRRDHTIIMATHNPARAARTSQHAAFLHDGRLVEHAPTEQLLTQPLRAPTKAFLDANAVALTLL